MTAQLKGMICRRGLGVGAAKYIDHLLKSDFASKFKVRGKNRGGMIRVAICYKVALYKCECTVWVISLTINLLQTRITAAEQRGQN